MKTSARIEVHPSVMFKLGEDLITDEVQALAELVKNAYDADSPNVIVRIVTTEGPEDFPQDNGYIEVIDRGTGMSIDDIRRGWLTLSNSHKREQKEAGVKTKKGRTPLGDKGLGRLGAQRLGNRLSIVTDQGDGAGTHMLSFDWRDFVNKSRLSEIDLTIATSPSNNRKGTTIRVSDLKDPKRLSDVAEVERVLASIISPYEGVSKFKLRGSVNGITLDLGGLEKNLRGAATIHYDLEFGANDELIVRGRMRLNHLRPNPKKDRPEFERLCESDQGADLLRFLQSDSEGKDLGVRRSERNGWWIEFHRTVRLVDLQPVYEPSETMPDLDSDEESREDLLDNDNSEDESKALSSNRDRKKLALPGPFRGEVDVFNLSSGASEHLKGFDSIKILREQVGQLAGIRVYRDGFTIRVAEDWLGLGKGSTSGGSWYGLRPGNTMGYIQLTAEHNHQLVETTDREGFSRTPHYENFEKLMEGFTQETNYIQECIGRSYVKFRTIRRDDDEIGSPASPYDLTNRLSVSLAATTSHRESIIEIRANLDADAQEAEELIDRILDTEELVDDKTQELLAALNSLGRHAARASETTAELEQFIEELESQKLVGDRLQAEIDALDSQLSVTYETMAVGLLAEALSHEIANIADRLSRRTSQIARYCDENYRDDPKLLSYIEHVRGSISGLRRQIAHLAPTLRYVRESRERIKLSKFLPEVEEYFASRWHGDRIELFLEIHEDFSIHMNRGKFLQIFDNLLLNSEYWLKEQIKGDILKRGMIYIRVEDRHVDVWDNGIGVDPEVENSLFEPFVTRKPQGFGRGLGLFIVRRLLEAEACDVVLRSDRNKEGRRYIFRLELSGVIEE